MDTEASLSGEEIDKLISTKMSEYEVLGFMEQYAMFMGKAQILEFGLKGLLTRFYGLELDSIEKWTLGRVKKELDEKGIRKDFIVYLCGVVEQRNYFAHEFLVNHAITKSVATFTDRKLYGDLYRAMYQLERIIILFDWFKEHNAWE